MSTHTDGARSPSVGSDGVGGAGGPVGAGGADRPADGSDADGSDGAAAGDRDAVPDPDAVPPRPRSPAPPPGPHGPPDGTAAARPASRRGGHGGNGGAESGWVQEEIRRRIAARGAGEAGRHSRSDRTRSAPDEAGGPGEGPLPPGEPPAPRAVGERATPLRPRSTRLPDPYAPDGMRDSGADGGGFTPEQPYRMPGPAASAPDGSVPSRAETVASAPPKQWPPADGAAGLPRRVPGAGWTLDRRLLGDGDGTPTAAPAVANGTAQAPPDVDPETRMVPALWTAARIDAGPPTADLGIRPGDEPEPAGHPTDGSPHADGPDADADAADEDLDDGDLDDDHAPTGLATGDTEVIWRAPGLDEPPAPAPLPVDPAAADPGPNPYTGARPRGYAAAPTDVDPELPEREPCPALDDAPSKGRRRIVLSERRAVAHSVRTVVDVQDPGPVGTMFRSRLVSTQLAVALRVGGVALIGLALLPALFAAFPSIGAVAVLGVPLPWILLGFLVYPFLLLLGWWYVGSAERIEQDFVQEVQDR